MPVFIGTHNNILFIDAILNNITPHSYLCINICPQGKKHNGGILLRLTKSNNNKKTENLKKDFKKNLSLNIS